MKDFWEGENRIARKEVRVQKLRGKICPEARLRRSWRFFLLAYIIYINRN